MNQDQFDACMLRICKSDREALKEIYSEYMKYVFSVIYQVVQNSSDAEDLTADFFIKLWTNAEKYTAGSSHKAFLATVARNMAIDFIRKQKREVLIADFSGEYKEDDNLGNSAFQMEPKEEDSVSVETEVISNISIKEALDKLKLREREVINMKIFLDMTFKEIAESTGSPMGTVTWLYRQAINKLRRCGYEQES